jgi:hypothetical protein
LASLVQRLQKYVPPEQKQIAESIDQQYKKIHHEAQLNKRMTLDITRIQRLGSNLQDNVSREIDFSPGRVKELIDQGYREASEQL